MAKLQSDPGYVKRKIGDWWVGLDGVFYLVGDHGLTILDPRKMDLDRFHVRN